MRPPSRRERIAAQLADLKMPGALEALDEVLAGVDGGGTTGGEAIERLLAAQIALRNSRRLEAAMRSSRLPYVRTLTDFAGVASVQGAALLEQARTGGRMDGAVHSAATQKRPVRRVDDRVNRELRDVADSEDHPFRRRHGYPFLRAACCSGGVVPLDPSASQKTSKDSLS